MRRADEVPKGFLDYSIQAFDLAVGPGMIRKREFQLNAEVVTQVAEEMVIPLRATITANPKW